MQTSQIGANAPTPDSTKDRLKRKLKRLGFCLPLLPPLLPFAGYLAAQRVGHADFWAYCTLLVLYGVLPVLDVLIGKDSSNPLASTEQSLANDRYFQALLFLTLPLAIASLTGGLFLMSHWSELSVVGQFGLILSFGAIHANTMINTAHELIHKPSQAEQRAGGFLLALVCYPGFKIEHIRGHHIHVATPRDRSTAAINQTLYHFVPNAIIRNTKAAWDLETTLLIKRGKPVWSWSNELLRWYLLVAALAALVAVGFGVPGLVFFFTQSLVAICVLECVNYLEHYGLRRTRLANGKYERTTHAHSWNSNFLLSNLLTFQLQRHSDHHASPQRCYQILRHFDDSPQLPAAYSAMLLLALLPPLWMRVMNPRVHKYYAQD